MLRLVVLFVTLLSVPATFAVDLGNRLGIGYSNQFGLEKDLPSLAVRYYPNGDYGLMGALGVDTTKDNSRFGASVKIIKLIYKESNLNFYTGAGAGVISEQKSGSTDSGFDLAGLFGCEFFFSGLENLGWNFEGGVGVTSVSSEVRFRTIGDHPLKAGIFFYF